MAKRKAATVQRQIVRVPMSKPPAGMRLVPRGTALAGRTAKRGKIRHYARKAAAFGRSQSGVLLPIAGAAGLGLLERMYPEAPKIDALGISGTYGLGLFAAGHFLNMPTLKALSVGPLACAVRDIAKSGELGVQGSAIPGAEVEGFRIG